MQHPFPPKKFCKEKKDRKKRPAENKGEVFFEEEKAFGGVRPI